MFSTKPHSIKRVLPASGYTDGNGDWISTGEPTLSEPIPCQFRANGSARTIVLDNSATYVYAYSVRLDADCSAFAVNEQVKLYDAGGAMVFQGTVKGFVKGQLSAKLWV